jgi:hypothetical protein
MTDWFSRLPPALKQWEEEKQRRKREIDGLSEEAKQAAREAGLDNDFQMLDAKTKGGGDPEAEVRVIRETESWLNSLPAGIRSKLIDPKTPIDTLYPVHDRLCDLFPDGLATANVLTTPTPIKECQAGIGGEVVIIGVVTRMNEKNENSPENVDRRGYAFRDGPTQSLNLVVKDDFDEILCKIDRYNFKKISRDVLKRGRKGKAIYVIKGTIPKDVGMIKVNRIRHLGDMIDAFS